MQCLINQTIGKNIYYFPKTDRHQIEQSRTLSVNFTAKLEESLIMITPSKHHRCQQTIFVRRSK